jgi:hypothetical protein
MANLIITPDDDSYDVNSPTFLVYDTESKELVHTCLKLPELDSDEMSGQGRPTFRPFGIASDDQYLYIASHNKLARFNKTTYEFKDLINMPLYINTHEMVVHNGKIYAANTSNDTIGIYDIKENVCTYFNVTTFNITSEVSTPDNVLSHDGAHVNSLCISDDKLYFCLHHLNRRDSQIGYFDINTYEAQIVAEAGRCNHGVQILNGKLYSLSTGTGEVIEVDLNTKDVGLYKVVDSSKTFLRGLDILDGSIIFGGSNTYSDDRTIYMNNCFVAEFNAETKKSKVLINVDDAYIISDMKVLS